ncbi:MAG TPA: hypothetical protein VGX25_00725 [Actinophytocola sp.]|uniref:hypothetical protein n=1 Tax=Actinophytocola sp. TaxID=1872138 RepID=UPI002DDD38C0|nr:hypothetical protein [Actinophytocola sp.]HEV2777901.1 hypothetical protein [Actinophytocola sp.]
MSDSTTVATAVLLSCLAITWLLCRARVFGTLTLTGFVLGSLATAAVFVLLG